MQTIGSEESKLRMFVYFFISISVMLPNAITLVSMGRTRGIPQNIKIPAMNLNICDILSGLSILLRVILKFGAVEIPPNASCFIQSSWTLTTCFGSMLIVATIAIDRFICLYYENAYITKVTVRKVIMCQVATWVLSLVYSLVTLVDHVPDYTDVRCFNPYIGPFGRGLQLTLGITCRILAFISYVFIYVRIKQMVKSDLKKGLKTKGTFKTTYKLVLIGVIFHVMYFPFLCYNIYLIFYPELTKKTEMFLVISSFLVLLNGCVNPFVYAWRFPECRLEAKKIFFFFNKNKKKAEDEKRKRILVSFLDTSSYGNGGPKIVCNGNSS
ncbi:Adrenocorticotropic hormone receptor [Mizuhopecten yessoensis]|uniref:Adrenocorticotropic hormone receptor n=1 Tax=Mizuhopecten yessoensis TaxID=6573 RepID=A0A210Q6B9_MIZYE|nr:Adrenocorticotropic hormone receptor [Mizuhopecten yessoensis]